MDARLSRSQGERMPDQYLLAQLVAYAGLLAATAEYCEILKRRAAARRARDADRLATQSGLYGLVRVIAADPEP
jgi:hypothetical protein